MSLCLSSFTAKISNINLIQEVIGVNQQAKVTGISVGYKSRMRWTQELHESFVQAVNDLGGADSEYAVHMHNLRT